MIKKAEDFTAYAAAYPKEIQKLLKQLRSVIKKAAPGANEVISYGMPAFTYNGMLVWFAAHTGHIGFYPRPSGMVAFKKELAVYKSSKGAVQFPLDEPLPVELITRMVKLRVAENLQKAKLKK
jgi:uncharacterized protein YdhG (YjbR/CyaY superfamily)